MPEREANMSSRNDPTFNRRDALAGLAGLGAIALASAVQAEDAHKDHGKPDAAPPVPLSAAHKAVIASTADCLRTGRFCLARCTDHLASGVPMMEHCQRAVMNMLAVVSAMADVAGYANAKPADLKLLAKACAEFCRSCAEACEPHASHHEECQACMDACLACAKACDAI
jgi:Cys-rich four helix bundle protein (predicted Tat secretion target)